MLWLFFTVIVFSFIASFYRLKIFIYSAFVILIVALFRYFDVINNIQLIIFSLPIVLVLLVLNIKTIRQYLVTKPLYTFFCSSNTQWQTFQRIDDGWFATEFEKSIFCGEPQFIKVKSNPQETNQITDAENKIYQFVQDDKKTTSSTQINKLAKLGATSLLIDKIHNGKSMAALEVSVVLKNISKISPVIATILGILNLDSLISIIHHFGDRKQKEKFLPLFSSAKMIPFLKPTSLYETLDSQKSSIEGRVDKEFINGEEVLGVKISFQDVILLGTSQSNCFYLNVNVKDFNNLHSDKTHLGTAICIINKEIKEIEFKKGLKAYDNYLNYYACTGKNVFIPFENIVNGVFGIGKGLEYLYKNQCFASNIWPLAISIPTNKTATLTAWYFAHLQKQNGRQLLSFKVVMAKLNEQFSQCLKLQLIDNLSLHNNLRPELLKFTAILNKETHISQTINQLGLLRTILGSNSHNIKTESNLRTFYKVAHLATELDGMSHEINQLPLMKKASLACHPYYFSEVDLLAENNPDNIKKFDEIIFQHIGYILHNLTKTWAYTLRTSFLIRLFVPKNKYKYMIKRMSSSFAFISDIALINWTFKAKINTSFASSLAQSMQNLTSSIVIYDQYINHNKEDNAKELTKTTLKNTLYNCQNSLKSTINLAFNRFSAILMKLLIFPFGKPFHLLKVYKPLHSELGDLCKIEENSNSPYTKYSPFLEKIFQAKQKLQAAEPAEIAVTNATGTPLNTDNYEVLINRCLAAGIVSVEQSEKLRNAYECILEIKLTNHFGNPK